MSAQDVDNQTGGFVPKYYRDDKYWREIKRNSDGDIADEALSAALDGKYQFLNMQTPPYTGANLKSEISHEGGHQYLAYIPDRDENPGNCGVSRKIIPSGNKNGSHYRKHPSGVECIKVVAHYNFNVGNIIKYAWRLGEKDDPIKELDKIIDYANFEKKRIQEMTFEQRQNYKATI